MMLGFILGPLMEENLRRSLVLSRGDPMIFIQRPISAMLLALTARRRRADRAAGIPQDARGSVPGVRASRSRLPIRQIAAASHKSRSSLRSTGSETQTRCTRWTFAGELPLVLAGLGHRAGAAARQHDYPNQDIHFICAFPPGSGADVLVRYFADKVRPLTGRNVIVENRSGAGGNIAIEYVARAKPDGYTVFVHGASGVAASMSLFKKPPVDVGKTIQVAADHQPAAVHGRGRCQVAASDAGRSHRRDEAEGRQGELRDRGAVRHAWSARSTSSAPACRRSRSTTRTRIDSLNDQLSGSLDYAVHDPVYALAAAAQGRSAHPRGEHRGRGSRPTRICRP